MTDSHRDRHGQQCQENNGLEFGIVPAIFAIVTAYGFRATRWHRASALASIEEWGLGGRRFGTWVTWFLLGGDLYIAYTFVAVPALLLRPRPTRFPDRRRGRRRRPTRTGQPARNRRPDERRGASSNPLVTSPS